MKTNLDLTGIGGFKSRVAPRIGSLAALGFLSSLGFIPGWERLFGFAGFFCLIGVAYIVEALHRVKSRNA